MIKTKILISSITLILIFLTVTCYAENLSPEDINLFLKTESSDVQKGDNTLVGLYANSPNEQNVSAFRIKINFDGDRLEYKGTYLKEVLDQNELSAFYKDKNNITIIYLTNSSGFRLEPCKDTHIFNIKFTAKEGCESGNSVISAEVDGLCNYNAEKLPISNINDISIDISDKVFSNCTLLFLEPSEGFLVPDFHPDIYNYTLDASFNTKYIYFNAEPTSQSCTIKINRQTLNSAGTSTPIKITVQDIKSHDKLIYTVIVNREPKPDKESPSSNNGSNKSKKDSSSKNGSSKNSSNSDKSNKSNSSKSDSGKNSKIKTDSEYSPKPDKNKIINASNQLNNPDDIPIPEKTILVKENHFNSFLAGVSIASIIVIIVGIIINKNIKKFTDKDN